MEVKLSQLIKTVQKRIFKGYCRLYDLLNINKNNGIRSWMSKSIEKG